MNVFRWIIGLSVKAALLVSIFTLPTVAFASSVTPKKGAAKVFDAPDKGGKVLMQLKNGDALDAIERKGMFWKVKLPKGGEGFVSFLDVQRQAGSASSLAKAIRGAAQDSRGSDEANGVRARSAVMGVRGLDESDEVSGAGTVSPNLRMVYAMEDLKIGENEIGRIEERVFAEIERRAEQL